MIKTVLLALPLLLLPQFVRAETVQIPDEVLQLRDPFRKPQIKVKKGGDSKGMPERYPVESLKLVGVLTGPERVKAMLVAPDGQSFFVAERMKIGHKNGIVRRITPDAVYVREKTVNLLGQEENIDTEIRMRSESKKDQQDQQEQLISSEISPAEKNKGADVGDVSPEQKRR